MREYQTGEFVVKPIIGVCRVEEILHLEMSGADSKKLYYRLVPLDNLQEKIYVPVSASETSLRPCMTAEEAWKFIERIPGIEAMWIDNEKTREQKYKEAVKQNDLEALISIIKMIYWRKRMRMEQGKKATQTDEKYFQMAEKLLYLELGTALGKSREEVYELIVEFMEKNRDNSGNLKQ